MNTDLILTNISRQIELLDKEKEYFCGLLDEISLHKNDFILRAGDPCDDIYFVNRGTLRAYFISPSGKESTIMFAVQDWWITDMYCFLNERPSMVFIQAVSKSEILKLPKRKLDMLYDHIPALNKFFRVLMQNAYCREQLRMIENLSLPSADRYHNFLAKYPQIANEVPLKQIASYLGITPEFLSAIRAKKR